jgi:ribonuclease E
MASTEDLFNAPDASDTPAAADSGDGGAAPAPAQKRARRATKKASAPAPVEAGGAEGQADGAGDLAAEAPVKKVAKKAATKTAKKASSKRTAAKKTTTAPATETPQVDASPALDAEMAAAPEPAATSAAAQPAASAAAAQPAASAAAAPSFGVLFQAPDPSAAVPRRRSARKAAGPPEPRQPEPTEESGDTEEREPAESTRAPRSRRGEAAATQTEDTVADDPGTDEDQAGTDDSDTESEGGRRRRRRGGKGRGRARGQDDSEASDSASDEATDEPEPSDADDEHGEGDSPSSRRRRRRRRSGSGGDSEDPPGTVTRVRESRRERDEPQSVKGSTRLEAKKQRRREGREAGRRRTIITEAEFLARRESVERVMVVREREGRTQIGVLEDDVLVEHYVSRETNASMAGNVYLGRVQNVLPSMEAAFVDIGKGRNAVLYAGEVNWDAAGLENNQPRRIENALKSGDAVLVQVTKDPMGHKGARLTSQVSLPGRYLVYVPEGSMTGISRKLPDTERSRLKSILKEVVPDRAGVIVRTAAEGASEEELRADVERLSRTWESIKAKADAKSKGKGGAPVLVHGEPDLTVRVIRDVFNEDFTSLVVAGDQAYGEVSDYLGDVAPDLAGRLQKWTSEEDLFTHYRVDEQIAKAMDRKVWLPSGGSLVIDRTEAMTVVDVNTGKFVGSGGNLEETVTKNNIEAAEEIVRQLRLRDIGGIIVIDFIDMVLESNRDLVVRRLLECLGRDRTKHQVAEVTSLGLVQMTRKRVGSGLIEVFSETCDHCGGRGIIVHADPVDKPSADSGYSGGQSGGSRGGSGGTGDGDGSKSSRSGRGRRGKAVPSAQPEPTEPLHSGPTPAQIAAAAHAAALKSVGEHHDEEHDEEHDEQDQHEHDQHERDQHERDQHGQDEHGQDQHGQDQHGQDGHGQDQHGQDQHDAPAPAADRQAPADRHVQPPTEDLAAAPPVAVEPAPKRRKRGRVVAPAGPPRAIAGGQAPELVGESAQHES